MAFNQLIWGDNLPILQQMPAASVDLVYLDPPFFTNRQFSITDKATQHTRQFDDRWSGGITEYIDWLYPRVAELHRLLKPNGSLYLHCDWHADAYIRVQILDAIFGADNFLNHLVWHYVMGASATKNFGKKYDSIFWYAKNHQNYTFNLTDILVPYNPETIARSKRGDARYKQVLDESNGKNPGNVWTDIHPIQGNSIERVNYPTQKPEKLLERIILASSNQHQTILGPFAGSGTTLAVANNLGRYWIGIDESEAAINVCKQRLSQQNADFVCQKTINEDNPQT